MVNTRKCSTHRGWIAYLSSHQPEHIRYKQGKQHTDIETLNLQVKLTQRCSIEIQSYCLHFCIHNPIVSAHHFVTHNTASKNNSATAATTNANRLLVVAQAVVPPGGEATSEQAEMYLGRG